ncbi:hypothetical protein JIY74_33570 [Vibrio harveyi]|nr:hypothetical protein [Vibrio harveyi]
MEDMFYRSENFNQNISG